MKLEIDYIPETETSWDFLRFRQEGQEGFTLPMCCLPEFVEALTSAPANEAYYFWQDRGVHNTARWCTITVSANNKVVLKLSAEQRTKLVAHLRASYTEAL